MVWHCISRYEICLIKIFCILLRLVHMQPVSVECLILLVAQQTLESLMIMEIHHDQLTVCFLLRSAIKSYIVPCLQSSHIGDLLSVFVVQSFICSVLFYTHNIVEEISRAVSVGTTVNSLVECFRNVST